MANIVDSYSESNYSGDADLNSQDEFGIAQSFTGNGETLDSAKFYLYKLGLPTGNAVAKVYAHTGVFGTSSKPTGSALATSDNFDVSTLTTSIQLHTLNFSGANRISLTNGTKYVIALEYSGGDLDNTVFPGVDDSSPTHGGNFSHTLDGSSWSAFSGIDSVFYVYSVADTTTSTSTTTTSTSTSTTTTSTSTSKTTSTTTTSTSTSTSTSTTSTSTSTSTTTTSTSKTTSTSSSTTTTSTSTSSSTSSSTSTTSTSSSTSITISTTTSTSTSTSSSTTITVPLRGEVDFK